MSDLLDKLTYLLVNYLIPLLFPGIRSTRGVYAFIFNKPIVALFALIPFVYYIIHLFWRLIKNI